ncbi:stage III sporulation protein AG [Sutcliffiella halmapala]|uniref:stage III sporulation protein AG n=1 Tax=Sutcliffiella halmapala TaxID=79882 RepID=UPI000995B32C|nr:stage III sporulation protein AG [Sutcliffiella halmapala]
MEKKNQDFIPWLKSLLFDSSKDKKSSKRQYIIVVLVVGVGFMLFSNLFFGKQEGSSLNAALQTSGQPESESPVFSQKDDNVPSTISDYETHFENQLKEALEAIIGVGNVNVVVNVDATEKQVLQKNVNTRTQTTEEKDKEGGTRSVQENSKDDQVVMSRKGNDEHPIVLETKKPAIRGVLVVAQGAENINVKKMILEAVTRMLDVPQHKVAVLPKKSKGE